MARRKVKVVYIGNEAVRRATFRKRRRGLLKKAEELATLCDVGTCAVVYGEGEVQPEVWPSEVEARAMLLRFKDMPPSDQWKKMLNQEGFMQQRITKQSQKLRRILVNNQELQMNILMLDAMAGRSLHDLSIDDAAAFSRFLEVKAKALHDRIRATKERTADATTTKSSELVKDELPAVHQITEWTPMSHNVPATTTTSSEPVKDELLAVQQLTEWAPIGRHNAPAMAEVPSWQRNEWGMDILMPTDHSAQMFFGSSGSDGLEEMMQPYTNTVHGTWMPLYYDPWPQWPACEDS